MDPPKLVYMDPPFFTQKNHGDFNDKWENLDQYITWLRKIVGSWYLVLKASHGSLVLHLDQRASHAAKLMLDDVYGPKNFRNEIIWSYNSGGASRRHLSRKHDTLLWYTADDNYTFNPMREPYATPNVAGRPGFHPEGRLLTDVWNISIISTTGKERLGYATQKPVALLDRLVKILTDEGDWVADPFCGSGTTGIAAVQNHRSAYLSDINPRAIELTRYRMKCWEGRHEMSAFIKKVHGTR